MHDGDCPDIAATIADRPGLDHAFYRLRRWERVDLCLGALVVSSAEFVVRRGPSLLADASGRRSAVVIGSARKFEPPEGHQTRAGQLVEIIAAASRALRPEASEPGFHRKRERQKPELLIPRSRVPMHGRESTIGIDSAC